MRDYPVFPLDPVALSHEVILLHMRHERFKTMLSKCLLAESEFGVVRLSDDSLREIGGALEIDRVLERMDDGRMNLLARGIRRPGCSGGQPCGAKVGRRSRSCASGRPRIAVLTPVDGQS